MPTKQRILICRFYIKKSLFSHILSNFEQLSNYNNGGGFPDFVSHQLFFFFFLGLGDLKEEIGVGDNKLKINVDWGGDVEFKLDDADRWLLSTRPRRRVEGGR